MGFWSELLNQSWLDSQVADPSSRRPGANKMGLLFSQKASYAAPCCKMDNKPERPCRASNGYDDDCICRKDNGFWSELLNQSWLDSQVADPSSRRPGANKMGLLFSLLAMLTLTASWTTNYSIHVLRAVTTINVNDLFHQSLFGSRVDVSGCHGREANKVGFFL